MPLYEYQCRDCDTRFETLVRSTESTDVACTECESSDVKRVVSGFAMVGGYDDAFQANGPGGGCCGGSCGCGH